MPAYQLAGYSAPLDAQSVASAYTDSHSVVALASDVALGITGVAGDLLGNLIISIRTAISDVLIKDGATTVLTLKSLAIGTTLVLEDIDLKAIGAGWKVQIVNASATGSSVLANGIFT